MASAKEAEAGVGQQLREVGSNLQGLPSPPTKDVLVRLLKQAGTCLSELDQSPSESMLETMQPLINSIVRPELLKHQDRDIKLLVATCICEITRITAPEAPYSDDILRDIFCLILSTFSGLSDVSGPSFGRRVIILETLARYRSCVVMLDLECDDLVNEMFATFFSVVSDDHPESVLTSMQTIMVALIEESEDVREDLLLVLLSVLGQNKNDVNMAARRLAMIVIEKCAVNLEPGIKQFLISSISGDRMAPSSQINYHKVIYDIYSSAPQILSGVLPYLAGELLTDHLDTRLKAVRLVGDLIALPGSIVSSSEAFQPIFSEFLKRLTDRAVEIRMSVLEHVKTCLLLNPSMDKAPQIISSLCDRLLDYDENVRKQVVAVVCDITCHNLTSIPVETTKLVAERLRDKSLTVKKYTMDRLAQIYRLYCLKISDGSITFHDFDWIPGKILRCLYDKDFRSDTIESVLCGSLFPNEFSNKDKVKQWVRVFSGFDNVEVKALEKILDQKQRLQRGMMRYLSLRKMYQDGDAPEFRKKVLMCFQIMSHCFTESTKVEENFQILDQLKDTNVWKILTTLLDPSITFLHASSCRDDLHRIIGEKHRLYDFLSMLSLKCSYLLFNKEHVKEILLEASRQKSFGSKDFVLSCMNLLVILLRFSPSLLHGMEENLVLLLKDDNDIIKEGVLRVLATSGGSIQEQPGALSSSVELMLERICVEGNRKHAKLAVHALAAITKDDGLKSLSFLYKRLVDMLEEKMHLPAVLQSLGCIAQTAMPIYETRESEIKEFIKSSILECSNETEYNEKTNCDSRSELCSLKVFGIKTLVKSYLPIKDAHVRHGIDNLFGILKNILCFGDISQEMKSRLVDKAHLKIASAMAVLRLSRIWDHKIPIDVFHLTLRVSEISFPQAKKLFLHKVYQYTKDRLLDPKYACALLFGMIGSKQQNLEEGKHYLCDIIQMCRQTKARHSQMVYQENILPYAVHTLAHCSPDVEKCKDVKAFELTYRRLYFFLSILLCGSDKGKSEATNNEKENISIVISTLQSIKNSEDMVDISKSKNSHAICDLGLSIAKRLAGKGNDLHSFTGYVSLPTVLYRAHEKKEDGVALVNEKKSWLADENILSHLESLNIDANERENSETANVEIFNDSEGEGTEVPLGKVLKRLKAQGCKEKKMLENRPSPTGVKSAANDVDVMKKTRELNLDDKGISEFESINGHEGFLGVTKSDKKCQRKKRKKDRDALSVPLPKRQRPFSAQDALRLSQFPKKSRSLLQASKDNFPQAGVSSFQSMEIESDILTELKTKHCTQKGIFEPVESDLLASCLRRNFGISSKREDKGFNRIYNDEAWKDGGVRECVFKNFPIEADAIELASDSKLSTVSVKKRKRRSIAGLAKCMLKEPQNHTTGLIDCRIKVWWPIDKQFYVGVVKSYDWKKGKHVVRYDDGDVEVLHLEKEHWELIDTNWKPSEIFDLSKGPASKEISLEHESMVLSGSRGQTRSKRSKKMVRGRTPRRNLKYGGRIFSESETANEAEIRSSSGESTPESTSIYGLDVNSGYLKEGEIEVVERSVRGVVELETEENACFGGKTEDFGERSSEEERQPLSEDKPVEDSDGVDTDANLFELEAKSPLEQSKPDESGGISREDANWEPSNLEQTQTDDDRNSSTDLDESENRASDSFDSHHWDVSDNETLGSWRRRVRKSD